MSKLVLPVGTDSFSKIRSGNYYYIDKTLLIKHLIELPKEVTLVTRPRRFGKSLNMSMLDDFFNIDKKSENLFKGLKIDEDKELCDKWMNKYPTIFVSFKDVGGNTYQYAFEQLKSVISNLYKKYTYLLADERMDEDDVEEFRRIKARKENDAEITDSLILLAKMLRIYHNKQVIILIDEYDVPMAKGVSNNYYAYIVEVMRSMYSKALKSNEDLQMAVVTGCLRIAKESIFTGLNNFQTESIIDGAFEEFFGFTDEEINDLLSYYDMTDKKSDIKSWYDGYLFGDKEVYCPWDVISYVDRYKRKPGAAPVNFWANTSSNDIIQFFLDSGLDVNKEFEILLNGGHIKKKINEDVTYDDLIRARSQPKEENKGNEPPPPTPNEENFWTILLMTGYLTIVPDTPAEAKNRNDNGMYQEKFTLRIPNREISILFQNNVERWFKDYIIKIDRTELINAIWNSDEETLTKTVGRYLMDTISYYDYYEDFYHAFFAGLLLGIHGCTVKSNRETGVGRSDVILKDRLHNRVAIFEVKRVKKATETLESLCDEGLKQIEENDYDKEYMGYKLYKYGLTCEKKSCLVKASKDNLTD